MAEAARLASKFGQILDIPRTAIESGEFNEGERIAAENELSRQ